MAGRGGRGGRGRAGPSAPRGGRGGRGRPGPRPISTAEAAARADLEESQRTDRPIIHSSRDNFDPPLSFSRPQPHDRILQLARTVLETYNSSTFATFVDPLRIEPLFSHSATTGKEGSVGLYVVGNLGLMAKVPLLIDAGSDVIKVMDGEDRVDMADWLRTLPPQQSSLTGEKGLEVQSEWYKATNQTYDFQERLPLELQHQVLELALGHEVFPMPGLDWVFGDPYWSNDIVFESSRYALSPEAKPIRDNVVFPNKSVLSLSRPLTEHLWEFTHKHTRKCFRSCSGSEKYINALPRAPRQFDNLQKLDLKFTNVSYVYFFGTPFPWGMSENGKHWQEARLLRDLPALKSLALYFRPPLMDFENEPWLGLGGSRRWHGLSEKDLYGAWCGLKHHFNGDPWEGGYAVACQMLLLDWIMTYAKDYIKHIPRVELCGWIKDDTRIKWEAILQDERDGIPHDMTAAKKIITNWDIVNLGPACHCDLPCNRLTEVITTKKRAGLLSKDIYNASGSKSAAKALEELRREYVTDAEDAVTAPMRQEQVEWLRRVAESDDS